MIVVGVDPGAVGTGIVVRRGDELLGTSTVWRMEAPLPEYVAAVTGSLAGYVKHYATELGIIRLVVVAVEDVVPPNPHLGLTNPSGIIGAAVVLGAVLNEVPLHDAVERLVVVPPGRNGSGPMAAYPAKLRPKAGKGRGRDNLRHERSAWDVAGAARMIVRIRESVHPA